MVYCEGFAQNYLYLLEHIGGAVVENQFLLGSAKRGIQKSQEKTENNEKEK